MRFFRPASTAYHHCGRIFVHRLTTRSNIWSRDIRRIEERIQQIRFSENYLYISRDFCQENGFVRLTRYFEDILKNPFNRRNFEEGEGTWKVFWKVISRMRYIKRESLEKIGLKLRVIYRKINYSLTPIRGLSFVHLKLTWFGIIF